MASYYKNPSIWDRGRQNTRIAFRHSLLKQDNLILPDDLSPSCTVIPAVDAYVYINNGGKTCNLMRRWAIQMAGTVKVVSPPELVEEIRETIRKMAAEYQV